MRHLKYIAPLSLCAGSLSAPSHSQTAADRAAVETVVAEQYRTFGARQADAYGALFTPEAVFITVDGMKMNGRQEIIDGNALFFGMVDPKKNNVSYKNLTVKFLNPVTAVTYSVWDGLWTKPAIADRAQSGYLTITLSKVGNRWLIASATNAFNWRGTPNYDLLEYDEWRRRMSKGGTTAPK
ncbi:YybH family protein [Sphingomonas sp. M1-B02]|uniref:YybH family protein n=1 Tax=Sphingomonas sp. M1-B02 TaxID=3114300 RepID=UPI002240A20A|nr:SgcJ/EcaC family oxidoreductase [Sphingomonas sp. S6-11]UZK67832.1 SgcJ/EcaC family oxidoreductase [Sphingomonas sp. S6-11]